MTAYTLLASTNIDALSPARTGGDTVATAGFTLTIDQDTRYGLGGGATFSLGSLTITATTGGTVRIDARAVRLIPYNTGSGNVPAYNTVITQSGQSGSGKLIAVQSSLTATPTAVGAAMPASGFIKVKQVTGTYASGALTGIGATSTGVDTQGFIEVVGDEAATVNANRLGSFEMLGAWYEVGTTSGSSATTYQLPTNGSVQYYPAAYVDSDSATVTAASWDASIATYTVASHTFVVGDELTVTGATPSAYNVTDQVITAVTDTTFSIAMVSDPSTWTSGGAAKVMEPYPCAGSLVAAASTATDAVRGKVCWATTGGVLRFGSDGTNTVGYVPPSGRRIRIPNILTANCTTAARGTNALPNATLATRYDFTTTGGGVINISKAFVNWYPSFAQAYSVTLKYAAMAEQLSMSEVAQEMTITRCAVGQVAAQAQFGLLMSLCFAGGYFRGNAFTSASLATSGRYVQSITDVSEFTFERNKAYSFIFRANATTGSSTLTRVQNCTWDNQQIGLGQFLLTTCKNLTFSDTVYHDGIVATTATNPMSIWAMGTNCDTITMNGVTFGGLTNAHPYTAILSVNAAGCTNVKLRNIGTSPSSQLSLGSANQTGTVCAVAAGAAASDIKLQRIFTSATRTNLYSGDNSTKRVTIENCMGDYADVPVNNMLDLVCKGIGATPTYAAQTAVYGTHWFNHFTSATVGRLAILMNETTALTAAEVSLTGNAAFTSAGGLYMPTIGMTATFTMPYFALGHTQFTNSALVMAGGTVGNYTYAYQVDTGSGFGAFSSELTAAALGTSLNGLGAITPSTGVKLRLRITTSTTNATAITSVYMPTISTAVAQANYYPLDTVPLTITAKDVNTGDPIENARVRMLATAGGSAPVDTVLLEGLTNASGQVTGTSIYTSQPVGGVVRRATIGYGSLYKTSPISATIGSTGLDLVVLMIPDQ